VQRGKQGLQSANGSLAGNLGLLVASLKADETSGQGSRQVTKDRQAI
jgi:hypothetical protein